MIEKRFVGSSGGVYDQYKGDRFTWAEWEEILRIMNNLDEKARERSKALSKLQKENEELRQFKNKTFDLLDKEITGNEEAIEWGEKQGVNVGAIGFHTNMLKILQKELDDD